MKKLIIESKSRSVKVSVYCLLSLSICISSMIMCFERAYAEEKELRIGVLTTYKMECGIATIKAVEMAADYLNSQGGVRGHKVKIYSADAEGNPEKGIAALKKLVEKDKVNVLVGGAVSGKVLAVMDYLKRYNIIFLNVGASSPVLAEKVATNYEKYKYHFRTVINAKNMANTIVEDELRMMVNLGYPRIAVLAEDAAWNQGLVNFLETNIPAIGGQLVATVKFDPKTADFAPIFSKITSSGAQVAVHLLAHTDTVSFFKQYSSMKAPFRLAGFNNPGGISDYWEMTGGACESEVNVTWGAVIRAPITKKTIPFYDSYIEKVGRKPNICSSSSYDAVMVLAEAIKQSGSFETESLISALKNIDYIGTGGRVVFDKKTHDAKYAPEYIPYLVTQWQKGGKWQVLQPKNFKTAEYQNPYWIKK